MKRFVTLGISLCLLGFISGCCCGGMQGCGFRRFGGCSPCGGGCGASYAPLAVPFGGGCNSCNGGGGILGGGGFGGGGFNGGFGGGAPPVYGAQPGAYYQPYGLGFGSAAVPDGMQTNTASMSYNDGAVQSAMTPVVPSPAPISTALARPDSLPTF
jgi:hypothetical protein